MTMKGTLSTLEVYIATLRRIFRRSMKRSSISWLRPSRRTTMCSAARYAETVIRVFHKRWPARIRHANPCLDSRR